MAAIIGNLSGRVLIQFDGQDPVEVGRIDMPITTTLGKADRKASQVVVDMHTTIDPDELKRMTDRSVEIFTSGNL